MLSLKKLDVFLEDHNKKVLCWRCLNSYTSENMLRLHKQKCGEGKLTNPKFSTIESHICWKKSFP